MGEQLVDKREVERERGRRERGGEIGSLEERERMVWGKLDGSSFLFNPQYFEREIKGENEEKKTERSQCISFYLYGQKKEEKEEFPNEKTNQKKHQNQKKEASKMRLSPKTQKITVKGETVATGLFCFSQVEVIVGNFVFLFPVEKDFCDLFPCVRVVGANVDLPVRLFPRFFFYFFIFLFLFFIFIFISFFYFF